MFYVDNNTGSPNMPTLSPAQSNTPTWFTEGDKNKGISHIGQDWLNILQAELLNILAEAGIKPDKGKLNQLTLSIKAIITENAYTQANNLKEIFDAGIAAQVAARGHLGLGKLATKDSLGAGDVDAVSRMNGGTFENSISVKGAVTAKQVNTTPNSYPDFSTSVGAQAGSQAPFFLVPVTLNSGDIFIPFIKEPTLTPDGKKAVVSFGFNKDGKKSHANPAVHVATEDGKYQLWEFDTDTGRLINNTAGGVALLSELAPVKKAIDDTQTGLAAQGVMWISTADDLSNLPSGAHRFARNNTGVTVLPSDGYFFLEVLAKRDAANGSCILATDHNRDIWIGLRFTATADTTFTWTQLNQTVENLGLTEAVKRALNAVQKNGDTMTGNLFLKSDNRMHLGFCNEDGNVRMYIYQDKGGDVRINNGVQGGGDFVFGKNGEFYSPSHIHAGSALLNGNGDTYGSVWGNQYISTWLNNQFAARDSAIDARATIDWVGRYFATKSSGYLANTGWFKDSSTGLILQWGEVGRTGYGTWVNFPIAFTSFCSGVFLTLSDSPVSLNNSTQNIHASGRTLSGFSYAANAAESTAFWLAIGG
ncbi:hypothetical protein QG11_08705 [Salmonella enterica subsp. enterica serovar Virchow]|nr:hypothetical protein [Salmonella enterica subsp. enterica serovar Virchow]